mmetsp:Transcript_17248/g.41403  ORF Transcript_17248/g.41403 Transcript_17248/m.41403 type:complete len:85 (-) Transcript_17248:1372-1626(-)
MLLVTAQSHRQFQDCDNCWWCVCITWARNIVLGDSGAAGAWLFLSDITGDGGEGGALFCLTGSMVDVGNGSVMMLEGLCNWNRC